LLLSIFLNLIHEEKEMTDITSSSSTESQNIDVDATVPLIVTKPLDKYSLKGMLSILEKQTVEAIPLLGNLVLLGQFTIWYAPPNTGKTLITLNLILGGIDKGLIQPEQLYYLNMDDTGTGLVTKLSFAEEYGFHMLAEGERNFKSIYFLEIINELIDTDQCFGRVIVLDTLKKFIDVMDKGRVRIFTSIVRTFVQKGGTILALGHTNKRPDAAGKAIYGGVSDFVDDADCVYTVSTSEAPDPDSKLVIFENIKRRGDVDTKVAFKYLNTVGASYPELVTSVEQVDVDELESFQAIVEQRSDEEVIKSVISFIEAGITTKMKLSKAVSKSTGISTRAALRLIEKYTGSDPQLHIWDYEMRNHGAQQYSVNQRNYISE
jgi:archaellum biogenesis ATPase FlaH